MEVLGLHVDLIPFTLLVTLFGAGLTAFSKVPRMMALITSLPAVATTTWMFYQTGFSSGYQFATTWEWIPGLNMHLEFAVDGLSAPLAWLTAILTPLVILYSWKEEKQPRWFFGLIMLLDVTVMGVFTALDLFLFYIFWEFVLIPMFLLIAIWGGPNRRYASFKFLIYTGTASLVMLLGFMALGLAAGGVWSIPGLTDLATVTPIARSAGLLIFSVLALGFLVKMPSVPFHTWLPDAHVQAPTAGSVILAGVLLKMGSYGLMRIAFPLVPDAAHELQWIFFALGATSVVYGAFLCLAQDDLKSLIAYSSVSHMGLITIALATFTELGWSGAAFMNVAHGIISAGMFMAAGSLQHATGTRLISRLGGIVRHVPALTALTAAFFLASLGLPGMMGFIAEFTIFAGIWQAFGWWIWIPITSILVTAGYYLYALQRGFYGPEKRHADVDWGHMHDVPTHEKAPMALLVVLAILFGVVPGLLMSGIGDWSTDVLALMGGAP